LEFVVFIRVNPRASAANFFPVIIETIEHQALAADERGWTRIRKKQTVLEFVVFIRVNPRVSAANFFPVVIETSF